MTDLRIGGHYDGVTPQYERIGTRIDNDGRPAEVLRVTVRDNTVRSSSVEQPRFGPNDLPELILGPVERDISQKREMLARTNGFDAVTGRPNYSIQGERRSIIERELQQLEHLTLPVAQQRAREAAAWHAAQPTNAEKLQEKLEHRAAIFARASDIADQAEAEREAEKILRMRRSANS
jgi:hypothetical protein